MSQKPDRCSRSHWPQCRPRRSKRPRYAPSPCSHSPSGDRSATRGQ
jgi:hypothetical protein